MIEFVDDRTDSLGDVRIIYDPLHALVQFAFAVDAHLVAVAVEIPALMACRHLRQLVRSLEGEVLPEFERVIESVLSVHSSSS